MEACGRWRAVSCQLVYMVLFYPIWPSNCLPSMVAYLVCIYLIHAFCDLLEESAHVLHRKSCPNDWNVATLATIHRVGTHDPQWQTCFKTFHSHALSTSALDSVFGLQFVTSWPHLSLSKTLWALQSTMISTHPHSLLYFFLVLLMIVTSDPFL